MTHFKTILAAAALAAAPGAAHADDTARVTFTSTLDGVLISQVLETYAIASTDGFRAGGAATKPLCEAPCTFALPPGYVQLQISDGNGGSITGATRGFTLAPGDNAIHADPGSMGRFAGGIGLTTLGLLATIAGGVIAGVSESGAGPAMLVGGGLGLGVGIWCIVTSMSSLEMAPPSRALAPAPVAFAPAPAVRVLGGAF